MEHDDHAAFEAYMESLERQNIPVTVCPPQRTPRWAKQHTAVARGIRLGNGGYMRGKGNNAS